MNISKDEKRNSAYTFIELCKYKFEKQEILITISFLKTQELLGATQSSVMCRICVFFVRALLNYILYTIYIALYVKHNQ